ncbi:MAG: 16S rRNA (adenine(1518)-N(6)/adenine(1519)-N(6))-dimethyltransferase RsmA [Pseudomonadota bacterium]
MPPILPTLKEVIDKHGLFTRKSLGQHFLLDSGITDKIALYAGDLKNYNIIEIGSGPGGLTRSLLAAGAKSLTVIEKDDRGIAVMEELAHLWNDGRLKVIHGDALKVNLLESVPAPRKIVANLPYNVGTMLLLQWLDDIARYGKDTYESLTLMFQDEVAGRIIASPDTSEYGRLSVISQFLCECRYDFQLPPGAFSPPPKVHSAVITLTPHEKPLSPVSKDALEKVVAAAFGQRRKMLRSALKPLGVPVETLLEKAGIDGTLRAEVLDVATFCRLTQVYEEMR